MSEPWLEEGPVRPYVITGGRSQPTRNTLTLVTLVVSTEAPACSGLLPEHLQILGLCHRMLSVAEVASHLGLPASVAKVLLADLLDAGLIDARPPVPIAARPDSALLGEVLHGLHHLR